MRERHEFIDYVIELFGPFGTVAAKRMFGGWGVYLDGLMFAIVAREAVWLKADEISRSEFVAAGCEIFAYERGGAQATLTYFRPPADAMESPSAMLPWARTAYAAALRANARRLVLERERAERVAARTSAAAAKKPGGARNAKKVAKARATRAAPSKKRAASAIRHRRTHR